MNADAPRLRLHVPSKTKLRQEWLQGQVPQTRGRCLDHKRSLRKISEAGRSTSKRDCPVTRVLRHGGSHVFPNCLDSIALHQH